jgi:hypothetical protein
MAGKGAWLGLASGIGPAERQQGETSMTDRTRILAAAATVAVLSASVPALAQITDADGDGM